MSFSHAYRLAVKRAVRVARKFTAVTPATERQAAANAEQAKALRAFRQTARTAILVGVPFKKLERELNERIGMRILNSSLAAEEDEQEPD